MSHPRSAFLLSGLLIVLTLALGAQTAVLTPAPLDSTLYTTYTVYSSNTGLALVVCGSTSQSSGCYGSANLGPFGKIGALLEGTPFTKDNVVTRAIYILDVAAGTSGTGVDLDIYKKTDTITADYDSVSVTLAKTVTLPLTGGLTAGSSMAANAGYLFIGTDQSPEAVEIKKSNLSVTAIGGFFPPINVTSITADPYGYVTVTQGSPSEGEDGFYVFAPNGEGAEDGGGGNFMLNSSNAVLTASLPPAGAAATPVPRLYVQPKPAK